MSKRKSKSDTPWIRPPAPSFLNTRCPVLPHVASNPAAAPREGRGDYRRPVLPALGTAPRANVSPYAVHHNPARAQLDAGTRANNRPAVYTPRQNGLPEFVPYRYRAGDWEARAVAHGLDLEACAAADREVDAIAHARARAAAPPPRTARRRRRPLAPA